MNGIFTIEDTENTEVQGREGTTKFTKSAKKEAARGITGQPRGLAENQALYWIFLALLAVQMP